MPDPIRPSRDPALDALRGFAVLLVVIGHAIQRHIPDYLTDPVWRSIYSFHMPLFLLISGMLVARSLDDGRPSDHRGFVVARWRALVVPFLVWIPIVYVAGLTRFSGLRPYLDMSGGIVSYAERALLAPALGLWYLWVLFMLSAAAALGAWVTRRAWLGVLGFWLVSLLFPYALFGIDLIRWFALPFLVGMLASPLLFRVLAARVPGALVALLVPLWLLADLMMLRLVAAQDPAVDLASAGHYAAKLAWALLGVAAFGLTIVWAQRRFGLRRLVFLGTISLEVYALHLLFLGVWLGDGWWQVAAASAVALVAAVSLAIAARRLPSGVSMLLFGRSLKAPSVSSSEMTAAIEDTVSR